MKLSGGDGKPERSESKTELAPLLALQLAQLPPGFIDRSRIHR